MRPDRSSLFPFSLLLVLLLLPLAAVGRPLAHDDAISLCAHTDYRVLCLFAAHHYGCKYDTMDAASLLSMHLDMATEHTRNAKLMATRFHERIQNPREKGAFEVCISQFGDAIDELATARTAIAQNDAGTANAYMSAAITYYSTCDDAFAEIPANNPLAKQDKILGKMVSNALALGDMVLG